MMLGTQNKTMKCPAHLTHRNSRLSNLLRLLAFPLHQHRGALLPFVLMTLIPIITLHTLTLLLKRLMMMRMVMMPGCMDTSSGHAI
jgi:hypothetical protein